MNEMNDGEERTGRKISSAFILLPFIFLPVPLLRDEGL
jgi:hypothetical protein